jgi:hypothetical protein
MFTMDYATSADSPAWFTFDKHISQSELAIKIRDRRCYLLKNDTEPIGTLRYNLFWDSIPFLTLIFLAESARQGVRETRRASVGSGNALPRRSLRDDLRAGR